ncbi:metalloregulator ArsR/SmtB family transcription factor [Enterococcus hirae]|jgi:DNA-binding transcriptional ArsR family regulator|nr:metalloregulator ArsR/SmtB family transcription factor [Enterococcaceae bacterium]MCI1919474.1 metalloregulator ArsR/SmtB family transcription factor [Enterococcaceae bacterium]MDM8213653.1 metalloregulator ArsR/SmtB family transcription factor [Enterococcus hirae]
MNTSEDSIQKVSRLFKVLSDPTRIRILALLEEQEENVTAIANRLDMEQSAVSHQLKLLRDAQVVKSRRVGKEIFYSLDDQHVVDILSETFDHIAHSHSTD